MSEFGGRMESEPRTESGQDDRPDNERTAGIDENRERADECRTQDEGGFVGSTLIRKGGVDETALIVGIAGDRLPANPREWADLRHRETGGRSDRDGRGRRRTLMSRDHKSDQSGGTGEGLDENNGSLADAVGKSPGERRADGVGDGKGTGCGPAQGIPAGRRTDEDQCAHLAHGKRNSPEEGYDDVGGSCDPHELAVGGNG